MIIFEAKELKAGGDVVNIVKRAAELAVDDEFTSGVLNDEYVEVRWHARREEKRGSIEMKTSEQINEIYSEKRRDAAIELAQKVNDANVSADFNEQFLAA